MKLNCVVCTSENIELKDCNNLNLYVFIYKLQIKSKIKSMTCFYQRYHERYGSWIYNYLCQSVPITTDVVSSNPDQGEAYNIM